MAGLTAKYAAELFDLATEHGALDECVGQAVSIRDALQAGKGRVAGENHAFWSGVLPENENIHADLLGYFRLLTAKRQESLVLPFLTEFIRRGGGRDGKLMAHVVSAVGLTSRQTSALAATLSQKLGKPVEISFGVDRSLIGGLCVYVDGLVIDHSVKKQLGDMRDAVKKGGAI